MSAQDALAQIFRGAITVWDDPVIVATTHGATVPHGKLTPRQECVHDYCTEVDAGQEQVLFARCKGTCVPNPMSETWGIFRTRPSSG